jgi:hypothetical protein
MLKDNAALQSSVKALYQQPILARPIAKAMKK